MMYYDDTPEYDNMMPAVIFVPDFDNMMPDIRARLCRLRLRYDHSTVVPASFCVAMPPGIPLVARATVVQPRVQLHRQTVHIDGVVCAWTPHSIASTFPAHAREVANPGHRLESNNMIAQPQQVQYGRSQSGTNTSWGFYLVLGSAPPSLIDLHRMVYSASMIFMNRVHIRRVAIQCTNRVRIIQQKYKVVYENMIPTIIVLLLV